MLPINCLDSFVTWLTTFFSGVRFCGCLGEGCFGVDFFGDFESKSFCSGFVSDFRRGVLFRKDGTGITSGFCLLELYDNQLYYI